MVFIYFVRSEGSMAQAESVQTAGPLAKRGFGKTERRDAWWLGPLLTGLGLGGFVIYSTFRVFYNGEYHVGPGTGVLENHAYLLSPFFSPLLKLGLPAWISPAIFVLWAPGGFRLTCYYYRKAYYRAFFLDPAACAVGEPAEYCGFKRGLAYKGETNLLRFQNLHRYFLYLALLFLIVLAIDAFLAAMWPTEGGGHRFGVSVGTLVLTANVFLLSMYTFSCHSLRHLVGGRLDSFSRSVLGDFRHRLWSWATVLNERHMMWAWLSLFMVGFADFYVWMVAAGKITDFRFF